MMGSKGCKGGNKFDCLPRNARRKIKLSPREIRAAKRSFWKRKRREAKAEIRDRRPPVRAASECHTRTNLSRLRWCRCKRSSCH